jgi:hypothetical protein
MPKAKARNAEKKREASYEAFRAEWERAKPRRQSQRGRGKPGDMNYRPPVIGSPRPHKTSAADFLDELLWLAAYLGNDVFHQAPLDLFADAEAESGRSTIDAIIGA